MANVSYQPWYVLDTFPGWSIPLATDNNVEDLTGINTNDITLIFRNTSVRPSVDTVGTGTFTITNAKPAILFYKPSAADVASPFSGVIIIRILFPPSFSSADLVTYDPIPFTISA